MSANHILLVDDNEAVGGALREYLTFLGFEVRYARSADEGWALFQELGARAVITDNVMSGNANYMEDLSGFELASRVKAASPETPVVMLSALPPPEAMSVCDAVLSKPVRLKELSEVLERLHVRPVA